MYGTSWSSPEPGTSGTLPRVILTSSARAAPPLLAETGSEEPSAPDDGTALLWSQRRRERLAGAVRRGDGATDVITAVVGSLATRSSRCWGTGGDSTAGALVPAEFSLGPGCTGVEMASCSLPFGVSFR